MKLDLFYEIDAPRPWKGDFPENQRAAEQKAYAECLDQIEFADSLGFHTAWLVEHHFREGRSHCSCPEAVLGNLAARTKNLRLGFGVTLVPHDFLHPARVAEKVATVDILSGGRVEWGTGRSTPFEQQAFEVDQSKTRAQQQAAIKTIVGMWENEYYSEKSEFIDFPERMVLPKPVQMPHPPGWMAATSPESSAIAGSLGMGLLSFTIMQPIEMMADRIRSYREAIKTAEPITGVLNNRVAAYTLVHCADTMEQAEANGVWDAVWWWYQNIAEFILEWEIQTYDQAMQDKLFPLLSRFKDGKIDPTRFNDADMIIVGDPETCIKKMKRYADLGVDQLLCYTQFGSLSHESVMRNLELLGKEVIPELEDYVGEEIEISLKVQ